MSPKWKYFWDFLDTYEQGLNRSYLELAEFSATPEALAKVQLNIQSKLELIKLLQDYFKE
jgi:hypothetical protein